MEAIKEKDLIFSHFSNRLKERYNIHISYKNYLALCFNESLFSHIYSQGKKKNVVLFRYNEQWIIGVRDKKGYLITCLPIQKLNKILIKKL